MNNEGIVYTDPNQIYAMPATCPEAPAAIDVLKQPIIGEGGFDARRVPRKAPLPATFTVTFDLNIEVPSGTFTEYIQRVFVGVLGMGSGDRSVDVLTATQHGAEVTGPTYAFPEYPEDRLRRRLFTTMLMPGWYQGSWDYGIVVDPTITFTLNPGYHIATMRALWGIKEQR